MKVVMFVLMLAAHCELTVSLKRIHFFINVDKIWRDAQTYCRENYEDLSSVDSQEEFAGLQKASGAVSPCPWSWVGLQQNGTNWQWSDGSKIQYYKWARGQPNDPQYAHCGLLINSELYDYYCSVPKPFFCYKWDTDLIVVRENKTWEDALQHCRTHYTDLASLPTSLHLIQAKQTTAMAETPSVWTGLRFLTGSWFWVSEEGLGNLVQLPSCPANHSYCGARNLGAQRWENRNCEEKLNFVCY